MFRLIIADDEPIIREGICAMLDWGALGIEIASLCSNGSEVIAALEASPCDLIISDISMPDKTGIDIIRYIKESELDTKVIFVSGFSDFGYVQDALRYGAVDYITKPIDASDLKKAVINAIGALPSDDREHELREKLLGYGAIDARYGAGGEESITSELDLQSGERDYYTMLVVFTRGGTATNEERDLVRFSLAAKMEEYISGNSIVFCRGKYICALINHTDVPRARLHTLAERVKALTAAQMNMTISIMMGKTVKGIDKVTASYESAERLEPYSYFAALGSVIDAENLPQRDKEGEFGDLSLAEQKLLAAYVSEEASVSDAVSNAMRLINTLTYPDPQMARGYMIALFKYIRQELTRRIDDAPFAAKLNEIYGLLSHAISDSESFDEAATAVARAAADIAAALDTYGASMPQEIRKVIAYIGEHYSENLTLETLSGMVYMNPFYFSAFFKRHMKTNFKDYVAKIRIEAAKEIARTTDMKLYEIAEKTGFGNVRTLNAVFKAHCGKTIGEYKKENI